MKIMLMAAYMDLCSLRRILIQKPSLVVNLSDRHRIKADRFGKTSFVCWFIAFVTLSCARMFAASRSFFLDFVCYR